MEDIILKDFIDMKEKNGNKKILLNVTKKNGEHFISQMCGGHYVVGDVWFSEVKKIDEVEYPITLNGFIDEMERECKSDCGWGDLYVAPMEQVGDCTLEFCNDIIDVEDEDFKEYEITKIEENEDIVIYLKEI